MRKNSTLIYLVKDFQTKQVDLSYKLKKENFLERAEDGKMSPSEQTINNILGFARSYEVIQTEKNGYVEMTLN
jgi:hypothetical protein